MALPCEIATLWNICFANVKGEFYFTLRRRSNISQCAIAHYFTFGNAEYFTWKTCKFMLLYLQKGGVIMADSKLRNLSTDFAIKVIKMCDGVKGTLGYTGVSKDMWRRFTGYNTVNDRLFFFLGVSPHVINSYIESIETILRHFL